MTDRGLGALLKWKVAGGASRWPTFVPVTPVQPDARVGGLRITMIGQASLLIQAAGMNILTDPVWSERASPFRFAGPKRVTAPGVTFDDLPPIDVVLLSHSHYHHPDVATLSRLHAVHAPLIAMPLGNDAIVRAAVPAARCIVGDWWDRISLGNNVTTTLTPAYYWSNRWPSDTRMMLWSGHYLETSAGSIWFAGDTGYGDGNFFADIRHRLGPLDAALIPIGAYEPRRFMSAQHVNPAEAVRIFWECRRSPGSWDPLGYFPANGWSSRPAGQGTRGCDGEVKSFARSLRCRRAGQGNWLQTRGHLDFFSDIRCGRAVVAGPVPGPRSLKAQS